MPMSRSYFISTTPRTGSFLLAHALDSTGIAGRPQEYFDPNFENLWLERLGIASDAEFFEKVLPEGTTPNGVFSAKVHWHQFEYLAEKLQSVHGDGPILDLLERTFPGLRYVFLTRRDKVRQAVSYYRAIETNVWWSVQTDAVAERGRTAPSPQFDYERIDHWVTRLANFEWQLAPALRKGRSEAVRGRLRGLRRGLRADRAGDPPLSRDPDRRGTEDRTAAAGEAGGPCLGDVGPPLP